MKRIFLSISAVVLSLAASSASALTYFMNETLNGGSVSGYIVTDGALGLLTAGNITDWQFTLTAPTLGGGSPDVISFATQTQTGSSGTSFSATATSLIFDFDQLNGYIIFQGSSPDNFLCIESINTVCTATSAGINIGYGIGPVAASAVKSGVVTFATVAAVPEPEAVAMFVAGLGLIGAIVRRRQSRNSRP